MEIYDRDYNKADGDEGTNDWDTMRDLAKIWRTPGKVGFGFGPHNTVMVDDSARKMRHAPRNLVAVPEFKHAEHMRDGTMDALHAHLASLLGHFSGGGDGLAGGGVAATSSDVRCWCDANPPSYPPPPASRAPGPPSAAAVGPFVS